MNPSKDSHQVSSPFYQFLLNCSQKNIRSLKLLKSALKSFNKTKDKLSINIQADDDQKTISNNNKKKTYIKFSLIEDVQLKRIVSFFGPKNWTMIASFMPNKTARQCRDRYVNYLAPGFIHSKWTDEEDTILAQKYEEIGPHWSKIQKFFPYRTSNSIKNRYNYTVVKKLNSDLSQSKCQNQVPINDDISDFEHDFQNYFDQEFDLNERELSIYDDFEY